VKFDSNLKCNCGVYKITRKAEGLKDKVYVGSSANIKNRWREHLRTLRKGTHKNRYLQKAYDKYGESSLFFEIIECTKDNKEDLIEREQFWIDFYKSYEPENGYNISPSAYSTKGIKFSEETKKLFSEQRKGRDAGKNNPFYGKKHSIESKEKIRNKKIGTKLSKETRMKMSESRKGEKHSKAKLSNEDIFEIIKRIKNKEEISAIAKSYNVEVAVISSIKQGKSWTHVTNGLLDDFLPHTKITKSDIREIEKMYSVGKTYKEISERLNIHYQTVYKIVNRQTKYMKEIDV
jgi:group I intron endonuclease